MPQRTLAAADDPGINTVQVVGSVVLDDDLAVQVVAHQPDATSQREYTGTRSSRRALRRPARVSSMVLRTLAE